MKRGLLNSYVSGIVDFTHGESYVRILRYFLPELISAFLLYSLPFMIDAYFIGQLASTTKYATLGSTNNLIHFLVKLAESISVGIVVMAGQFNGMHAYHSVGRSLRDAFWVTVLVGFLIGSLLYFGAYPLFVWYGIPKEMMQYGIPFLRMRAVGVFFIFLYMALVGFMRGVKNTRVPMMIFMVGGFLFVLFDYLLIFGNFGFPRLELQGSALASVVQYSCMTGTALLYILLNKEYRKFHILLWRGVTDFSYIKKLILLSWPIVIDKATISWAYIWLCKMINPLGAKVVATFCVVKDIERFSFLPAIAFAQVITFLVSNDVGMQQWESVKSNLKKICFMASIMVLCTLSAVCWNPEPVIRFFDKQGEFTSLAVHALPIISVLVLFDLVQLILSGALRGSGNVKLVMYVRLAVCLGYFVPLSYILSMLPIDESLKFILVYASFYFGNALMSIAYINRFRSDEWKLPSLKGSL